MEYRRGRRYVGLPRALAESRMMPGARAGKIIGRENVDGSASAPDFQRIRGQKKDKRANNEFADREDFQLCITLFCMHNCRDNDRLALERR